jgi:hypothetical protein
MSEPTVVEYLLQDAVEEIDRINDRDAQHWTPGQVLVFACSYCIFHYGIQYGTAFIDLYQTAIMQHIGTVPIFKAQVNAVLDDTAYGRL